MGAGAIPINIEKAFRDRAKGKRTLNVYTADSGYAGQDKVDVSFNGGNFVLTPHKHLIFDYKLGKLTGGQFRQEYFKFLENSFLQHKYNWDNLLDSPRIVLTCSCNADDQTCHRYFLIEFLKKFGAVFKGKEKG